MYVFTTPNYTIGVEDFDKLLKCNLVGFVSGQLEFNSEVFKLELKML